MVSLTMEHATKRSSGLVEKEDVCSSGCNWLMANESVMPIIVKNKGIK